MLDYAAQGLVSAVEWGVVGVDRHHATHSIHVALEVLVRPGRALQHEASLRKRPPHIIGL